MKIGIVCYPTYGGSGVVATELGKGLAQKGYEIHFISYSQPFRLDNVFNENLFYHDVSISDYPLFEHSPYTLILASKLVDVVLHHQLDLLHVHYAIPHATAAHLAQQILLTKGIFIPFITTLHGTDITLVGKEEIFEPIVSFAINNSNGVTAVSEALKQETYRYFNVSKDIAVIPNFIDLSRFSHKPKSHFKKAIAPENERIVIHISNFRPLKRVDNVIKVFAQIIEKIPAKLLMVGDGPERNNAEKLARDLCLTDHIRFLGKQDAVEEILSVSDLFLMPSETESFGLAALEAMACQVPVVSSNAGGLPEVNLNGITGFTVEVENTTEMAQKSIYILEDENRLATFKANALTQAQRFDIQTILPQYEQFYKQILENGKSI